MDNIESRDPNNSVLKPWYAKLRDYNARDVEDLCTEFRAIEERGVKAQKLEHIWEPSPFPIELPAAERSGRSDEPTFVPHPWLPRPDWLLGDVPNQPGEVRFAKDWRERGDKQILIVPISREQAEERHRNVEGYVLAARLTNGLLFLLKWRGEDRNHPDRLAHPDRDHSMDTTHLVFELYGRHLAARTFLLGTEGRGGTLLLKHVHVSRHPGRKMVWAWGVYPDTLNEHVSDYRGKHADHTRSVTDQEIEQLKFATPQFGEFEIPVQLMLKQLRAKGYGELT